MDKKDYHYFKKNVPYRIGVRMHIRDTDGILLDTENPYVQVANDDLRKFLQANKVAFAQGLLLEIPEPPLDVANPNAIGDEEALEIVKNYHQLKKRLPELTSDAAVLKLLNAAKASGRKQPTIDLIMERYEEVSPNAMQSVT